MYLEIAVISTLVSSFCIRIFEGAIEDELPIVDGYTARRGQCPYAQSIYIGDYTLNLTECAQRCNLHDECVAFLHYKSYYKTEYCYLKRKTCLHTTHINKAYIFYDDKNYFLITDEGSCKHSNSLNSGKNEPLLKCKLVDVESHKDCRAACTGYLYCIGYQYKDSRQKGCMIYSSSFRCPNLSQIHEGTIAQTSKELIEDADKNCRSRNDCGWSCYGRNSESSTTDPTTSKVTSQTWEANKTTSNEDTKELAGDSDWTMHIVIILLAAIVVSIIISILYRKKISTKFEAWKNSSSNKFRDWSSNGLASNTNEYESNTGKKFDIGMIRSLLKGNAEMVDPTKEIVPQIAFVPYNSKREIPRSAFKINEHLGSGNFGSVHKGEMKYDKKCQSAIPIAVKSMTGLSGRQEIQNFLYEIKIMGYVKPHINLVNMVGSCTSDLEKTGNLWLLIEYCEYGDLKTYLTENKAQILSGQKHDSRSLMIWAYHVSKGMNHLASISIMHGDLAARNVLLRTNPMTDGLPIAMVADFGLSKNLYYDTTYEKENRLEIPWKWTALEYLQNDFLCLKSDVWSYMVLVWEMFSFGKSPYGHTSFNEVLQMLINGYRLPYPNELKKVNNWSPENFYNKLSKICFTADPKKRASFEDVMEVITCELREDEKADYVQQSESYNSTLLNDFSRL